MKNNAPHGELNNYLIPNMPPAAPIPYNYT